MFDIFEEPTLNFRSGKELASEQELREAGLVRRLETGKDGMISAEIDYPNGITVSISGSQYIKGANGKKVELRGLTLVSAGGQSRMKANGEVVDERGRSLVKRNADGSVTVDAGNSVYTQYPDGTVRRELHLRLTGTTH